MNTFQKITRFVVATAVAAGIAAAVYHTLANGGSLETTLEVDNDGARVKLKFTTV